MSNHLSQDQFETCVLGRAGRAELEHISECPRCRAEFEYFGNGVAMFRTAMRDLADDRVGQQESEFRTWAPAAAGIPTWRWALVVAALLAAIVLPLFVTPPETHPSVSSDMSPEAVMERLNRHLAQTLPEPMQPMLSLISGERIVSEREGGQ